MTTEPNIFAEMGFAPTVSATSTTPSEDGYWGALNGLPFHIHPIVTPEAFSSLEAAIAADEVTVVSYIAPEILLSQVQDSQKAAIDLAYANAIAQPVSFKTAGGVVGTFDADMKSQTVLMQAAQGYALAGAVPDGFYWVSADNSQVPFVLADLGGLYQAILARGWAAMQKRQNLKAEISAAATIAAVQSIVWG